MKKIKLTEKKKKILIIGLFVFTALCLLIYFSVRWALKTWVALKMEELVYTLTSPIEGTGNGMIQDYLINALLPTVILTICTIIFITFARKKGLVKPAIIIVLVFDLLAGGWRGVYKFSKKLHVPEYIYNQMHPSTFIEDNYVNPDDIKLTFPKQKRNLIYIFCESMETTYADIQNGGGFQTNVIPELTKLAESNEDFSGSNKTLNGGFSPTGTTWTMGGIFAMTAGLPLKLMRGQNAMNNQTSFFEGLKTTGDILNENGYHNEFLLGSDATFGGRSLYFTSHGNYNIVDYNYAKEKGWIPSNYKVFWGYEDQKLFAHAKKRLKTLSKSKEPFNLTMLTVDTHFEDGFKCELCDDEFGEQYADVMHCSSKQLVSFVKWCQKQDWYDNTTIILSGDHPTMDRDFTDNMQEGYVRKTYTCYINSAVKTQDPTLERKFTTLDNFPTTFAALGVKIPGNRLGLGTNLFSSEQTLAEKYTRTVLNEEFSKRSVFMEKFQDLHEESITAMQASGELPTVKITNDKFKKGDPTITVHVEGKKNFDPKKCEYLRVAISKRSDGAKAQSIKMTANKDGTYSATVDVTPLTIKKKIYIVIYYKGTDKSIEYLINKKKVALVGS